VVEFGGGVGGVRGEKLMRSSPPQAEALWLIGEALLKQARREAPAGAGYPGKRRLLVLPRQQRPGHSNNVLGQPFY
jgi:hypothetical protein